MARTKATGPKAAKAAGTALGKAFKAPPKKVRPVGGTVLFGFGGCRFGCPLTHLV